jgi:hypothetical protein
MAKRPRNKKVDRSIIEQGGSTPIRALTAALSNRRDRKEDREYQESLRNMGMFDDAGGRGRADAGDQGREEFRGRAQRMKAGGKVKKMKAGGKVRGCGMAKQGVRAAKMVKMKGS